MMPIANLKSAAVLFLGAVAFLTWLHPASGRVSLPHAAPTVVRIDKTPRGVAYKVDSKPITDTPTTNLLYVLNRVNDEHGSNSPVVVLIDPRVPIIEMWNFNAVAGKAQLANIRYFVFIR
jgi:hypothetical protein